jgi:hypothetical protein
MTGMRILDGTYKSIEGALVGPANVAIDFTAAGKAVNWVRITVHQQAADSVIVVNLAGVAAAAAAPATVRSNIVETLVPNGKTWETTLVLDNWSGKMNFLTAAGVTAYTVEAAVVVHL